MAWVWLSRRNSFGQLSPFIFSNIFGSEKAFCEIGGSRFGFFGTMRLFSERKRFRHVFSKIGFFVVSRLVPFSWNEVFPLVS